MRELPQLPLREDVPTGCVRAFPDSLQVLAAAQPCPAVAHCSCMRCGGFDAKDQKDSYKCVRQASTDTSSVRTLDAPHAGLGSCALVFSSGSLLRHEYGEEIDAHDSVVRFNLAPVTGYERHVGKRTTVMAGSSHILDPNQMEHADERYESQMGTWSEETEAVRSRKCSHHEIARRG